MERMHSTMRGIEAEVSSCRKCPLWETRRNTVFGEGDENADLMIVSEAPGASEDGTGRPFTGKAGRLLDSVLGEAGLDRSAVYIANVLKCRPPRNRDPLDTEAEACLDYLRNQVMLVRPRIILLMGSVAVKRILGKEYSVSACRGKWVEKRGISYLPTYHPAAVLRDVSRLRDFREDVRKAAAALRNPLRPRPDTRTDPGGKSNPAR